MEGDRLVGQEPQFRENARRPNLTHGNEAGGWPVTPTWDPDGLPHSLGCLLSFLLVLGKGHTYRYLRHKRGHRPHGQALLHSSPQTDSVPPRCQDLCSRGLGGRTSSLGLSVKTSRTQVAQGGVGRSKE